MLIRLHFEQNIKHLFKVEIPVNLTNNVSKNPLSIRYLDVVKWLLKSRSKFVLNCHLLSIVYK